VQQEWIKKTGILTYDPPRFDPKRDFKKQYKLRTLIATWPLDDLDLYFQWWLRKQHGTWLTFQRPMFGTHLTIVRGNEGVSDLNLWDKQKKLYQGEPIEFEYSLVPYRVREFWVVGVRCIDAIKFRRELKIYRPIRLHITIGRHQHRWQLKRAEALSFTG